MQNSAIKKLLCCAILALPLSGCVAASIINSASDFIVLGDVNITEKNYAAADYLAGLTRETIPRTATIYPEPLLHANATGMSSTFGALVSEQVASRFAQLGYNVYESDPKKPMSLEPPERGIALRGTYLPSGGSAHIALRLVNLESNKIAGAFDYTLPVNGDLQDLMEDKPTVIRLNSE
tara:strand:+ start:517 stop:1053 length:537 start_codon:yes stop_codon:yes gene_type:complete